MSSLKKIIVGAVLYQLSYQANWARYEFAVYL